MVHRQAAQQHLIEQRKDGGVGADAERQREHRHHGEAGRLDDLPQREAKILRHVVLAFLEFPAIARRAPCSLNQCRAASMAESMISLTYSKIVVGVVRQRKLLSATGQKCRRCAVQLLRSGQVVTDPQTNTPTGSLTTWRFQG